MNEPVERKPVNLWRGVALFSLDIWLGAAAIAAMSYLLFRWSGDFFAATSFWGDETTQFGQFTNVVKTAASLTFIICLLSIGAGPGIVELKHINFFDYGVLQTKTVPRGDSKTRVTRAFLGLLGGSILTLLFAFLFLPWLSALNFLSGDVALEIKPIRLIGPERILLTTDNPTTSTIATNLFELDMEKEQEYLLIIEPVEQVPGNYYLLFPAAEIRQKDITFLGGEMIESGRIDWQLVTIPKSKRVKFEVLYVGTGQPANYRIHVLPNVRNSVDKISYHSWLPENQIASITFRAEAENAYVVLAWAMDEGDMVVFRVNDSDGREQLSTYGNEIQLAFFRPSISGEYDVKLQNPMSETLKGFELLIIPIP